MIRKKKGTATGPEDEILDQIKSDEAQAQEELPSDNDGQTSEQKEEQEFEPENTDEEEQQSEDEPPYAEKDASKTSSLKERFVQWLNNQDDESLMKILTRGLDYVNAVEEARKEGEIAGRNARIEQLIAEETAGDGVPHPSIGSGGLDTHRAPSIFDIARTAGR